MQRVSSRSKRLRDDDENKHRFGRPFLLRLVLGFEYKGIRVLFAPSAVDCNAEPTICAAQLFA